jgi:SAM-dependent methyltransferase
MYDALAPWYHLVYQDWEDSIARQGRALASLLASEWGALPHSVLDAAVGIGTHALGLAELGFQVTGSDISPIAVDRAGEEAARRGLRLGRLVADGPRDAALCPERRVGDDNRHHERRANSRPPIDLREFLTKHPKRLGSPNSAPIRPKFLLTLPSLSAYRPRAA